MKGSDAHGDDVSTALQQEFQKALQDLKPKRMTPKFPKPASSEEESINIVFEGAGSKCMAYIGVVRALEENGKLKNVKDYVGSFDSLDEEDKVYLVRCGYLAASRAFTSSKKWF